MQFAEGVFEVLLTRSEAKPEPQTEGSMLCSYLEYSEECFALRCGACTALMAEEGLAAFMERNWMSNWPETLHGQK